MLARPFLLGRQRRAALEKIIGRYEAVPGIADDSELIASIE